MFGKPDQHSNKFETEGESLRDSISGGFWLILMIILVLVGLQIM